MIFSPFKLDVVITVMLFSHSNLNSTMLQPYFILSYFLAFLHQIRSKLGSFEFLSVICWYNTGIYLILYFSQPVSIWWTWLIWFLKIQQIHASCFNGWSLCRSIFACVSLSFWHAVFVNSPGGATHGIECSGDEGSGTTNGILKVGSLKLPLSSLLLLCCFFDRFGVGIFHSIFDWHPIAHGLITCHPRLGG